MFGIEPDEEILIHMKTFMVYLEILASISTLALVMIALSFCSIASSLNETPPEPDPKIIKSMYR